MIGRGFISCNGKVLVYMGMEIEILVYTEWWLIGYIFLFCLFIPHWDIEPQPTHAKPAYLLLCLAVPPMSFPHSLSLSLTLLHVLLGLLYFFYPEGSNGRLSSYAGFLNLFSMPYLAATASRYLTWGYLKKKQLLIKQLNTVHPCIQVQMVSW